MDNVNAKLQYLKGMKDGISKLDGDRYLLVEEIINTLEVMVVESAKISERMQREIEKLQSLELDVKPSFPHRGNVLKRANYDYFDDITAPFPYKNHAKVADVWYDESLNVGNYLKDQGAVPTDKESIKVERICKHCGSYVTCNISADELDHTRIQCPKCKRFLLPFDSNGVDTISKDIDEQLDHLEPPSLTTDIAKRLSQTPKSFHWEVSEEVFNDDEADDYDDDYNINSIIKDFETYPLHNNESYAPPTENREKERMEEEDFESEPYEIGGGLNQAWQYYEERPHHLQFEGDATHEVWKEPKNEAFISREGGTKNLWKELREYEERPVVNTWQEPESRPQPKSEERPAANTGQEPESRPQPKSEERPVANTWQEPETRPQPKFEERPVANTWQEPETMPQPKSEERPEPIEAQSLNQWKLKEEIELKPEKVEVLDHDWKLGEEAPSKPEPKIEELNHHWKLHEELEKKQEKEELGLQHKWQLGEGVRPEPKIEVEEAIGEVEPEEVIAPVVEAVPDVKIQDDEIESEFEYESKPVAQSAVQVMDGAKQKLASQAEKLEIENSWNKPEISDVPIKHKEEQLAPVQPIEAKVTETPKEAKAETAEKKTKNEDENFDWNTDFEFSIDKILSMDKKEKEAASSKPGSDSKFTDDDFGKFKYSFDREDELERQRNKIAPNYNIDKKVLKKFSFLGYASELAKKNN